MLADTHAILSYLTAVPRISRSATAALDSATAAGDPIFVSAITTVEIQYLVETGRLSADDQRIVVAAVDDIQNPARLVPSAEKSSLRTPLLSNASLEPTLTDRGPTRLASLRQSPNSVKWIASVAHRVDTRNL